jgi:hypothetical protein
MKYFYWLLFSVTSLQKKLDHFQPKYNNKKFLWQTLKTAPPPPQ